MLPYILAIAIAIYSLFLFVQAFFSPVIHRKDDFLWSGVGLFYALVLWLCAGRITGAVLLGQSAATILVISFGWQTIKLRRAIAYPDQQSKEFSVTQWVQSRLGSLGRKKPTISPTPQPVTPSEEEITLPETSQPTTSPETETFIPSETETTPLPSVEVTEDETTETVAQEILETAIEEDIKTPTNVEPETEDEDLFEVIEDVQSATVEDETSQTLTEFPKTAKVENLDTNPTQPKTGQKKRFSFKNIFGLGKKRTTPSKPETVTNAIDQAEAKVEEDEQWDTSEPVAKTTPSEEAASTSQPNDEPNPPEVTAVSVQYEMETFVIDEEAKTVIETYQSEEIIVVDSSESELEAFVVNEEAETVIESYQAELVSSEPQVKAEIANEEETIFPTQPIEKEEIQQPTDKSELEVKEEKSDKTE